MLGYFLRPITWSIFKPGVELSPFDRVEILYEILYPGVEMLYVPAIGSNKKARILKDGCQKYETYRNVFFSIWGVNKLDITV